VRALQREVTIKDLLVWFVVVRGNRAVRPETPTHQGLRRPHFQKRRDKGCADESAMVKGFLFEIGRKAIMRMHYAGKMVVTPVTHDASPPERGEQGPEPGVRRSPW